MPKLLPSLMVALLTVPAAAYAVENAPVPEAETPAPPLEVPWDADETRLRSQLEQVRALNAQLRSEREALQRQVDELEAKVVAESKHLGITTRIPPASTPSTVEDSGRYYGYGAALLTFLLAVGSVIYWRRRGARR